jgi:prepilin-type N-terminal cleavage/methylation domain-containing protein
MDFKVTSTKRRSGMTMVELLVAVGIGSVMMASLASLSVYTSRSFAAMVNYVDLDKASRATLDLMSKEIRQTKRLISGNTTSLVFEDHDGAELQFSYNSTNRTLARIKTGEATKVLLNGCDDLTFSIYQRNPIAGTYNVYPTATPETCKLVQLRWTCSRDLIRARVNTESVQSAKIVIRKQ